MEQPSPIEIYPQDDQNSQAIMAKIRAENIRDESAIRALVDSYEFSSPETQQHIADRMIDLLKMGVFDQPEPKTINIKPIDTDAHKPCIIQ